MCLPLLTCTPALFPTEKSTEEACTLLVIFTGESHVNKGPPPFFAFFPGPFFSLFSRFEAAPAEWPRGLLTRARIIHVSLAYACVKASCTLLCSPGILLKRSTSVSSPATTSPSSVPLSSTPSPSPPPPAAGAR